MGVPVLGSAVNAWLVPLIIGVLLAVAIWIGLRWARSEHVDALAAIPLFSHLPRNRLMSILRSARPVEFQPGSTIVREGETGKGFYVITGGTATVAVGGVERTRLEPGAYFGEVAVIDGGPRSATIAAATQTSTLELTQGAFGKVLDRDPDVAAAIARELRARLAGAGATSEATTEGSDRETLAELCRRLRATENADWAQGQVVQRRGFQRLFARA